ncbi:hypothetical protein WISP_17378 [Willisornis vidua]|uniref:Uncharacterized protein n=1 Tax=Willisornis vidua TaxID=1566151 RepID=A0ABQ9DVT4_9PASS|nr:hypothetical protein WISP_17378 [Willisornis vidua]
MKKNALVVSAVAYYFAALDSNSYWSTNISGTAALNGAYFIQAMLVHSQSPFFIRFLYRPDGADEGMGSYAVPTMGISFYAIPALEKDSYVVHTVERDSNVAHLA